MRQLGIVLMAALTSTMLLVQGCGYKSPAAEPRVTTVHLSLAATPIEVHQETTANAVAVDQYGAPVTTVAVTFASTAPQVAAVNPTSGRILALAPGTAQITASIDGKTDQQTITVFKAPIRINEIKPNGDAPGGWVELFNPTADEVDMAGWMLTASDVFQPLTLPAGVSIPPGGFLAIDESHFPLGLRAADSVHLFSRFGVQVDSFAWTSNPPASLGRCPDGTGAFVDMTVLTRAAANACAGSAAALQANTFAASRALDKESR